MYISILPKVFPHSFVGPRQFVLDCMEELTSDQWAEWPSSFAVTSDAGEGRLSLWLSDTSQERLYDSHLVQRGSIT